ncbi:MAG: NAD(P)-dependent oxidoreductase [Chloroflexota bacterium]
MKLLLVGGSGMVGTFITPYLAKEHQLRVLDVVPPKHADLVEYVEGSIANPDDVARALEGCDSFVNMVMRNPGGANETEQTPASIINNYQVNTVGLHLLLWTAQSMGITRGVHVSTRSVHYQRRTQDGRIARYESEETSLLDAASIYGFTKGLGERICQYFCSSFGMRIVALRITGPRTREAFLAERRNPIYPELYVMDEEDLANAVLAALRVVQTGTARFDPVLIAADEHERDHNLTKAKVLLGWEPKGQRLLEEPGA